MTLYIVKIIPKQKYLWKSDEDFFPICSSNNKDYQKSVSKPTLMELEPGCRIFAPQHAMGEADLVAGEVKEFQIIPKGLQILDF